MDTMKIGVVVPVAELQPEARPFETLRHFALKAEELGFDSLWIYDHLLYRFPEQPTAGIWECWSVLSALAGITTRVELGTIVMCVPFRGPALLAKMAATVDAISGGRLILGLGAGWHKPEFDAFDVPFDHLASRFEEALQIIVPLLREGTVDFHGTYYNAPNCELFPRPIRKDMPILVGAGKPRMLRLTAEYADQWNTCWLGWPDDLPERKAKIDAACTEVGRDPATMALTVGVTVHVGDEDRPERARALSGSAEEVAAGLRAYADLGAKHLICNLSDPTDEALEWFWEAVELSRKES